MIQYMDFEQGAPVLEKIAGPQSKLFASTTNKSPAQISFVSQRWQPLSPEQIVEWPMRYTLRKHLADDQTKKAVAQLLSAHQVWGLACMGSVTKMIGFPYNNAEGLSSRLVASSDKLGTVGFYKKFNESLFQFSFTGAAVLHMKEIGFSAVDVEILFRFDPNTYAGALIQIKNET